MNQKQLSFHIAIQIPEGDIYNDFEAYIVDANKNEFTPYNNRYNRDLRQLIFDFHVPSYRRDEKYVIYVQNGQGNTKYEIVSSSEAGQLMKIISFDDMKSTGKADRTTVYDLQQVTQKALEPIEKRIKSLELRLPQERDIKTLGEKIDSLQKQIEYIEKMAQMPTHETLDQMITSTLERIIEQRLEQIITSSLRQFEPSIKNTLEEVVDAKLPAFLDFDKLKQDVKAELESVIHQQLEKSFGQLDSIVENKLETILDARISKYLDEKIPAFLDKFEQDAITKLTDIVENSLGATVPAYFERFKRGMEKSIINTLIVTNTQIISVFGEHLKSAGELISKQREEIEASTNEQLIELSARTLNFYGDILKKAGELINTEYFGENYMAEVQEQFADTRKKAETISTLLTSIIDKTVDDFGLASEKFRSFESNLNMILTELENAGAVQDIPLKVGVIGFNEYLEKSGDNQSLAEVYENYLKETRRQYEDYFRQFAADFKEAAANAANADSHVADKLETFVTNSIVPYVYLLDDELRKKGHTLPVPPIEETLQKLFEVSGLEEIKVIEKEDKYDSTLHEPVRWVTDEEVPRDAIVKLLRRGFIYNGKVLRRARVVVRQ